MKLINRNSTASATISSYETYMFNYCEEEHYIEVNCPVCDGSGRVDYYSVDDVDNEVRRDCPHCNGDGTIEAYILIDEIEDTIEEDNETEVTPYEDNEIDFSGSRAYDRIRGEDEAKAVAMLKRFLSSDENQEKIRELENKKKELDKLKEQKRLLDSLVTNAFEGLDSSELGAEMLEKIQKVLSGE